MNPLVASLVGSVVRWGITLLAARGIMVSESATVEIISVVVALVMLGWSAMHKVNVDKRINS